jgi:hypothetical protein
MEEKIAELKKKIEESETSSQGTLPTSHPQAYNLQFE